MTRIVPHRPIRPVTAVAAGVWLVLVALVGLSLLWPRIAPRHMLILAHRGITTDWPADTLEAVVAVRDSPAEGVEFDVLPSADGTWWLFHDHALDDRTTGSGLFWETTDAGLESVTYDAGLGYDANRHAGGVRLSRLDDVLDALEGYGGRVIVDAKDPRPGSAGSLARLLQARDIFPIITVQSADAAAEVKAVSPEFTTMLSSPGLNLGADLWIADPTHPTPAIDVAHDLLGDFGTYVPEPALWAGDPEVVLQSARDRGAAFVIVSDVDAALAWRASVER
jgi:hypothetical protein